jgi:hypothetical protein
MPMPMPMRDSGHGWVVGVDGVIQSRGQARRPARGQSAQPGLSVGSHFPGPQGHISNLRHMPLAVTRAYALILEVEITEQGRGEAIMPRRAESDQDSQCSATAMRKATRRMTQLYDDALAPAGLRSTQYAIVDELHRKGRCSAHDG